MLECPIEHSKGKITLEEHIYSNVTSDEIPKWPLVTSEQQPSAEYYAPQRGRSQKLFASSKRHTR